MRKKPGFVNVAGPFAMSGHRVAWEVFAEMAKIKTTWVPIQGGGPALTAIAGGHVDAAATNPGNVKPMIDAGKVRVIAVSSDKRLEDFPDVPTYKERGWDLVRYQWRGMMAKAGTPKPVIDRLTAAIQKAQQTANGKPISSRSRSSTASRDRTLSRAARAGHAGDGSGEEEARALGSGIDGRT